MAYSLDGQIYLELYFNGVEFPFSQINTFSFVHISASTKKALPALSLRVTDGERWLMQNNMLADGVQIRVGLAAGSLENAKIQRWTFRISHFDEKRTDSGIEYHIDALLDFPEYLSRSSKGILPNTTSSSVLQTIASSVGLKYLGVGTNDTQTWLPSNRRFYQFASYVAEHGFATDNSCMMMAVDLNGTLIYRDITSMDASVAQMTMVDVEKPGSIPIISFLPVSSPGGFNQMAGYAYTTIEQNLDKTDVHTSHDAVGTVINDGGDILMNADIKNSISAGKVRFGAIDAGNTHDNFYRAQHQNRRVAGFFTSGLAITTPVITNLQVLDTVTVDAGITKQVESGSTGIYEGTYRVATRVIYAVPGRVVEKISLVRRTLNANLPNSVPVGSTTIISDNASQSARTSPLKAPTPSLATFTGFVASTFSAVVNDIGSTGTALVNSASTAASNAISSAVSASSGITPVTPLLNTLLSNISSLTSAAVASIVASRASDPTADTDGTTASHRASGIASVTSAVNAQLPAIATAAAQATSLAGASVAVNNAASSLSGLYDKVSVALAKAMSAVANVDKTGSLNGSVTTNVNSIHSASVSSVTSINSAAASATATANTNLANASTYASQISTAQTNSTNTINAA